jgi:cyanophycinase
LFDPPYQDVGEEESEEPSKTLVLVGGNWQYPATGDPYGVSIYLDILERAGGPEKAKIGIFTTASGSAKSAKGNGKLYVQDFRDLYESYLKDEYPDLKIDVEWIPFHVGNYEKKRNSDGIVNKIKSRNAFIFGGGDQSLITQAFFRENAKTGDRKETKVFKALKEQYENGAVVAGTSAGTTVQTSSPMITEGESYEALTEDPTELIGSPPFVPELYYNPLGGLGFFDYGLLDTHFSERGRQGRIISLAAEVGVDRTFGVDENTALIVTDADTPDVDMEVLGQGGVFISDLSKAKVGEKGGFLTIKNVRATYLTEGDRYDPLTGRADFSDKEPLVGSGALENDITRNIFSWKSPETGSWTKPRAFTEAAIDLFASAEDQAIGQSYEKDPVRYEVLMTKLQQSGGFIGFDSQDEEKISFANLRVDIVPSL